MLLNRKGNKKATEKVSMKKKRMDEEVLSLLSRDITKIPPEDFIYIYIKYGIGKNACISDWNE